MIPWPRTSRPATHEAYARDPCQRGLRGAAAQVPRASCSRPRSRFMAWYLLYVLMSTWAGDFMSTKVVGNINVALIFGLLQFVSTFVIAWLYARYANRELDPIAAKLRGEFDEEGRPMSAAASTVLALSEDATQTLTTALFLVVVAITLGITFWASRNTKTAADYYAAGRNVLRLPERPGDLRRLHVRRVVPRHLRRHRAVRLRRLPLLDRLPGRVAGRAAAGRRADAQLRPLHDGRPAGLPDAAAPGAHRRRDVDDRGVDLLPAGPDGRRRHAGRAAARGHQRDRRRT